MKSRLVIGGGVLFLIFTMYSMNAEAARSLSSRRVLMYQDGGAIEIEAVRPNDKHTRDAVRKQLKEDAKGKLKSATPALKQHEKDINYRYENTKSGGRIRIVAKGGDALRAVQEFLRSDSFQSQSPKAVAFHFIEDTSLVVIPVLVNGHGPFRFLLDTGASRTILSVAVADDLKIPPGQKHMLSTGGGDVPATMRIIDSIKAGGGELDKLEVVVTDFDLMRRMRVDGILGGDYLRQFKVSIDYNNQVVEIEPYAHEEMSLLVA
jgi:hypothetical protein